jgi:hypothetical protein
VIQQHQAPGWFTIVCSGLSSSGKSLAKQCLPPAECALADSLLPEQRLCCWWYPCTVMVTAFTGRAVPLMPFS